MYPIDWASLRNIDPVSRDFGFERGTPVDRYYIDRFLEVAAGDIRGRVLEVGDDSYTRRFGGNRVSQYDVLHVHAGNPKATIIGDLATGDTIPSEAFDCAVITQTLHLIYDVRVAVRTLHRILKRGGTVLATVPGVSPLSRDEWAKVWYWAFTRHSCRRMFQEVFGPDAVHVENRGNVLASTCFLEGIAAEELNVKDLDMRDDGHDTLLTIRAVK